MGGNGAVDYYAPNYSRLLVFSLDAGLQLPPTTTYTPPPLNPPELMASAEEVEAGRVDYDKYCAICHGANGSMQRSTFPNLLRSPMLHSQEGFDQVVLQGVRSSRGMASFAGKLQPEDAAEIRSFLIARANEQKNAPEPAFGPPAAAEDEQEETEDVHADLSE